MPSKPPQVTLTTNVQYLKGVGPQRASLLNRLGIQTIEDLLYYLPRDYIDRSKIKRIAEVQVGSDETIQGIVEYITERRAKHRRLSIVDASIADESGEIKAIWFNQPYLKKSIAVGDDIVIAGKVRLFNGELQIEPQEYEVLHSKDYEPIHTKAIVPKYFLTGGLYPRYFRRLMWEAVNKYVGLLQEILPDSVRRRRDITTISDAIRDIHFPADADALHNAKHRLAYDEFFLMQIFLALRRQVSKQARVGLKLFISKELDFRIRRLFPFKLTNAQERVITEIKSDISKLTPMNRLLQGDVGSGKTIVAAYALLAAIGNHTQATIMAPTELLAEQHFNTMSHLLKNSKVKIVLLTSAATAKERKENLQSIKEGKIDLVIGTNAIIQKDVAFNKLSLVVIDEQHKFGVHQRAALRAKGLRPHTLIMTATPIPRTLSLTLFGDLDISVIDEMPPGRKPVRTIFRPASKLLDSFDFIRAKVREGRQAYFVYPLIDESDKLPLKSAVRMHETLCEHFSNFNVALLHGGIKQNEKDKIMDGFRQGRAHILVSTVVIEVGIDVPNATIMVIENAERYGLAQLHQLRGRIGRGVEESYCLLFGEPKSDEAKKRIDVIASTTDGFRIAEEDLRLRGPGEFFGIRQSGFPELRAADISRDLELLQMARQDAFSLVASDPQLTQGTNASIRDTLRRRYKGRMGYLSVG